MFHTLSSELLVSSSNAVEHSQAVPLDGASLVLVVADQIAASGAPDVLVKVQTSEDLVNWSTPTSTQNGAQLPSSAPARVVSGSPAGTALAVDAQYVRLVYTLTQTTSTALVAAGIDVSRA